MLGERIKKTLAFFYSSGQETCSIGNNQSWRIGLDALNRIWLAIPAICVFIESFVEFNYRSIGAIFLSLDLPKVGSRGLKV